MNKMTLAAAATLVVSGCSTQPQFDPSVTEVKIIDGKKFAVPKGANVSPHIATKKEIVFYQKSGVVKCKEGDIIWDAQGAQEKIAEAIRNGDPEIHKALAKKGLIGCASPLQ